MHTHTINTTPWPFNQNKDVWIDWTGATATATGYNSLATLPCTPCAPCAPKQSKGCKKPYNNCVEATNEETTKMNIEREKIAYLQDRIYTIVSQADTALERKFGLIDDETPRNPKELVDRITSGKYVLPEKNEERYGYGPLHGMKWRDPSVVTDRDGYKAAEAALSKSAQPIKDAINILPADQALKMLQDFEATTLAN